MTLPNPAKLSYDFFYRKSNRRSPFSAIVVLPYLAAIVLSLISFHTTYYGMLSFYGLSEAADRDVTHIADPIANSVWQYLGIDIVNLFAICFAAVVQTGILLSSAYLFRLLFSQRSPESAMQQTKWLPWFVSAVLLFLLPISIVFSYGARLEWQIGSKQKTEIQVNGAQSDAANILNTLKGMVREEGERLSKATSELPAFRGWMASLERLTRSVGGAPETMQRYLKSIEAVEANKRAVERAQLAQARQKSLELERRADLIRKTIEATVQKIKKIEPLANAAMPTTDEFDSRIAQFEAEMKKEQEGTGKCGIAGEGQCYKKFKAQRDKVALQKSVFIKNAEAAAREMSDKLAALKIIKMNKEVELANIVDQASIAGHEIKIDPRAGTLDVAAELPRKIEALQSNVGQYGIDLRQAINRLEGSFATDSFSQAVRSCRSLMPLTLIGDPSLRDIECEPAALAPHISAVSAFNERVKSFDALCGSLSPYVGVAVAGSHTDKLYERVSECIELSKLGSYDKYRPRIAELTDSLSKSMSNRSSSVDYLTFTIGQLLDGKRVAFLALFFAVAVDTLVLVFTFLAELPRLSTQNARPLSNEEQHRIFSDLQAVNDAIDTSDPMRFRFARAVVVCLQVEGGGGMNRLDLNALGDEGDRQMLRRRLSPFLTTGLAWDDPQEKNVVVISDRGVSLLAQECRRVMAVEEKATVLSAESLKCASADLLKRAV